MSPNIYSNDTIQFDAPAGGEQASSYAPAGGEQASSYAPAGGEQASSYAPAGGEQASDAYTRAYGEKDKIVEVAKERPLSPQEALDFMRLEAEISSSNCHNIAETDKEDQDNKEQWLVISRKYDDAHEGITSFAQGRKLTSKQYMAVAGLAYALSHFGTEGHLDEYAYSSLEADQKRGMSTALNIREGVLKAFGEIKRSNLFFAFTIRGRSDYFCLQY